MGLPWFTTSLGRFDRYGVSREWRRRWHGDAKDVQDPTVLLTCILFQTFSRQIFPGESGDFGGCHGAVSSWLSLVMPEMWAWLESEFRH